MVAPATAILINCLFPLSKRLKTQPGSVNVFSPGDKALKLQNLKILVSDVLCSVIY